MFPIPWNKAFRKKDGTLVNMEDMGGGGSALPEYSEADAGKVLSVDEEGELAWEVIGGTKVYYKEYDGVAWDTPVQLAKWNSGAAAESTFRIFFPSGFNTVNINITGYTPIGAVMFDRYMGYHMGISIGQVDNAGNFAIEYAIASRAELGSGSYKIRVYYVKNDDLEVIS